MIIQNSIKMLIYFSNQNFNEKELNLIVISRLERKPRKDNQATFVVA